MTAVTAIDAKVVVPFVVEDRLIRSFRTDNEAAALEWARAEVGPNQSQVSLTAHTANVHTFGIRHLVWENGDVRDTGWRIWREHTFEGAGELVDLEPRCTHCDLRVVDEGNGVYTHDDGDPWCDDDAWQAAAGDAADGESVSDHYDGTYAEVQS